MYEKGGNIAGRKKAVTSDIRRVKLCCSPVSDVLLFSFQEELRPALKEFLAEHSEDIDSTERRVRGEQTDWRIVAN